MRIKSFIEFLIKLFMSWTIVAAILFPLHKKNTINQPLPPLAEDSSFVINVREGVRLRQGDTVPLYRYGAELRAELGKAEVIELVGNRARCKLLKNTMLFPAGRQGWISEQRGKSVVMELGVRHGFKPDDELVVYRNHRRVGRVKIHRITDTGAIGRMVAVSEGEDQESDWRDLVVSEYTLRTDVSIYSNNLLLNLLEIALFLLVAVWETILHFKHKRSVLQVLYSEGLRILESLQETTVVRLRFVCRLLVGISASWFFGYFIDGLFRHLSILSRIGGVLPQRFAICLAVVLFLTYLWMLIKTKRNPLVLLWQVLAYKPRRLLSRYAVIQGSPAKWLIWLLNLVIAYAFSYTLIMFFAADVNVMIEYMAPKHLQLNIVGATLVHPYSLIEFLSATSHNLRILAHEGLADLTFDQHFAVLRLLLWSITVFGCLVGYVHSVLKIGPFTSVRNVDFTLLGWFTNGICYGPLLGGVLWSILPSPEGDAAVITAGPLFVMLVIMEFVLDLFYTASIWNMFTKFGVMVDKGMVRSGFFGIIRHPNYTLESFMFFALFARGFSSPANVFAALFCFIIYWLRSERDEVFMRASNPEYADYAREVRYKYIPGVI